MIKFVDDDESFFDVFEGRHVMRRRRSRCHRCRRRRRRSESVLLPRRRFRRLQRLLRRRPFSQVVVVVADAAGGITFVSQELFDDGAEELGLDADLVFHIPRDDVGLKAFCASLSADHVDPWLRLQVVLEFEIGLQLGPMNTYRT